MALKAAPHRADDWLMNLRVDSRVMVRLEDGELVLRSLGPEVTLTLDAA